MHVCMYLSISLFIYPSIYLSMYVCMYVCINLSIYPSIYLSMYVCMYVSISLSIYPSIYPSMYVSMYVSISLSFPLFMSAMLHPSSQIEFLFHRQPYIYYRCPHCFPSKTFLPDDKRGSYRGTT